MDTGWRLQFQGLNPEKLNHHETLLMVGNGYLCTRGSFSERYPGQNVATFLHGVYDDIPVSYTELANIPNWTALQIEIDGESFHLAHGRLDFMEQTLDMKAGLLSRSVRWESPNGKLVQINFRRFASMANDHVMAQDVLITPINFSGEVRVIASLDGQSDNLGLTHWDFIQQSFAPNTAILHLKTKKTKVEVVVGEIVNVDLAASYETWNVEKHPALVVKQYATPDEPIRFEKKVAIYTSRDCDAPFQAVQDQLAALESKTMEELFADSEKVWAELWADCDVQIESTDEAQLMARFSIYHMLIAAPRHSEQVSIGAKTLSGYGYRGHVFWDTEIFMLPFFTYTQPNIARNLLSYRYHRLAGARKKAIGNGFAGAQFPWESAGTGEEVTPTWVPHFADPTKLVRIWTGDIQIHITGDIAYAIDQYWKLTGDDEFMLERGVRVILEGAMFWISRLEWNATENRYEISDVIGPDENHDHVDNNTFTNFMAQWHIRLAMQLAGWMADENNQRWVNLAGELALDVETFEDWEEKAKSIYIPDSSSNGLIEQFSGFFDLEDVDLTLYADRTQSIQEIFGIEGAAEIQVLKQADIVMLMYLFRNTFSKDIVEKNYDYYSAKTDHEYGSSLGPAMHSLVASWIGENEEAYTHFLRAAKADLYDVRGNVGDGIHAASIGGIWQAIVFGFGGLTITDIGWETHPQLPKHWKRLSFKFVYQGQQHIVDLVNEEFCDD